MAKEEGEDESSWHLYDPVDDDYGYYLSIGSKKVIAFVFLRLGLVWKYDQWLNWVVYDRHLGKESAIG
jgi:hypothetical protein